MIANENSSKSAAQAPTMFKVSLFFVSWWSRRTHTKLPFLTTRQMLMDSVAIVCIYLVCFPPVLSKDIAPTSVIY